MQQNPNQDLQDYAQQQSQHQNDRPTQPVKKNPRRKALPAVLTIIVLAVCAGLVYKLFIEDRQPSNDDIDATLLKADSLEDALDNLADKREELLNGIGSQDDGRLGLKVTDAQDSLGNVSRADAEMRSSGGADAGGAKDQFQAYKDSYDNFYGYTSDLMDDMQVAGQTLSDCIKAIESGSDGKNTYNKYKTCQNETNKLSSASIKTSSLSGLMTGLNKLSSDMVKYGDNITADEVSESLLKNADNLADLDFTDDNRAAEVRQNLENYIKALSDSRN